MLIERERGHGVVGIPPTLDPKAACSNHSGEAHSLCTPANRPRVVKGFALGLCSFMAFLFVVTIEMKSWSVH